MDNKSSFLKTTHLHLPLAGSANPKEGTALDEYFIFQKFYLLNPTWGKKMPQFLLQPIGIGIHNPLSFFPKIPLTTNPEIIKESFIIFIHGFHLNLGLEKKKSRSCIISSKPAQNLNTVSLIPFGFSAIAFQQVQEKSIYVRGVFWKPSVVNCVLVWLDYDAQLFDQFLCSCRRGWYLQSADLKKSKLPCIQQMGLIKAN